MSSTGPVEILVTHLTRMSGGNICLAGIDRANGRHVRPVLEAGKLDHSFLKRPSGHIMIGSVLRFAWMRPRPLVPEIEDHVLAPAESDVVGLASEDELWAALQAAKRSTLAEIFGPEMHRVGRTAALERGTGRASLGVIDVSGFEGPWLESQWERPKIRARFIGDDGAPLNVPVTDLRLFAPDCVQHNQAALDEAKAKSSRSTILLSIGVGLPGLEPPRHWLQINNIHMKGLDASDWASNDDLPF